MDDTMIDTHEMEIAVLETTRELIATKPQGVDWSDLEEIGWFDLYEEDPRMAVSTLFTELGRVAASSQALDAAVLSALAGAGAPVTTDSPQQVIYPLPGKQGLAGRCEGDAGVSVDGILLRSSGQGPFLVPVTDEDGYPRLAGVNVEADIAPIEGVDPTLGLHRVTARNVPVIGQSISSELSTLALLTARRALAYESLGLAEGLLDVAIEHVKEPKQFGRPIGSYQAVKHPLAEVQVAIEAARAVLEQSWNEGDQQDFVSMVGKALSIKALDLAVRHSLQVCGGMGFTEEFPLAPLTRRAQFLRVFLGDGPTLTREIGARLMSSGTVPRLGSAQ